MYVENLSLVHGGYFLEVVPMVLDLGVSTDVSIPSFELMFLDFYGFGSWY